MNNGKSIRIYLADGTVTGIRHAEVVNWTGQAVICPRTRVSELADWQEAKRPGAYFLFGFDEESAQPIAYIGEAESVYERLQHHLANKEFWNEAVFFSNKDENLTKAHVKFVESRFVELAKHAKRYKLENGNIPQRPVLPRGDRDSMEQFVDQARALLGVLGHRVLEPLRVPVAGSLGKQVASTNSDATQNQLDFADSLCLNVKGVDARALKTDEGIVVLAGSRAAKNEAGSLSLGYKKLRAQLVGAQILESDGDRFVFRQDHLFSSPSAAAAVIAGYSINGRNHWRDAKGRSLAEADAETKGG